MASNDLISALKAQKDWAKAVIFDHAGNVLASTFKVNNGEIIDLINVFGDRDTTIGKGFKLNNEQYDCHRFHENVAYGRRGDNDNGEGIAIHTVEKASTGKPIFVLITYTFPTLSARAVPQLQEFAKRYDIK